MRYYTIIQYIIIIINNLYNDLFFYLFAYNYSAKIENVSDRGKAITKI